MARTIGSQWDYVAKLLTGLSLFKLIEKHNFFDVSDLDENSIDFSVLTTSLGYENIVKFLGLRTDVDPEIPGLKLERLKELTLWMFEELQDGYTRLGESRNLKWLNKIVASDSALKAFRAGSAISTAYNLTDAPLEIFQNSVRAANKSLETARDHIHQITEIDHSDQAALEEAYKLINLLMHWAKNKVMFCSPRSETKTKIIN